MIPLYKHVRKLFKKSGLTLAGLKANTIELFSRRDLVIIIFFAILGIGGAFAATLITVTAPDSQGAGYLAATSCDESITVNKDVVFNSSTKRFDVATISISGVDQRYDANGINGCGGRDLQLAIKANGAVRYTSWSIPIDLTGSSNVFIFGSTTSSISYQSRSIFTSFDATTFDNLAVTLAPGTSPSSFIGLKWYKISDNLTSGLGNITSGTGYTYCGIDTNNGLAHQDAETGTNICGDGANSPKNLTDYYTYYWTGYILWPTSTSNYVCFRSSNDDGFMLKINSSNVIYDNTAHGPNVYDGSGGVSGLTAGSLYPVEAWLHEIGGGSYVKLYWNTQVNSCAKTLTSGDTLIPVTNLLGQ